MGLSSLWTKAAYPTTPDVHRLQEVCNWDGVEWIVTEALAHGNKVVINADW